MLRTISKMRFLLNETLNMEWPKQVDFTASNTTVVVWFNGSSMGSEPVDLCSNLGSTINWLCDPEQIPQPSCVLFSSLVQQRSL